MPRELKFDMGAALSDTDDYLDQLEDELYSDLGDDFDVFMDKVESFWRQYASSVLDSTREEYLSTLEFNRTGDFSFEVRIDSTNPVITGIETGTAAFDLKPGFTTKQNPRMIPLNKGRSNPIVNKLVSSRSKGWIHPGIGHGKYPGRPTKIPPGSRPHEVVEGKIEELLTESFGEIWGKKL